MTVNLKEWRQARKLSRPDAAKFLGIPLGTLDTLEYGGPDKKSALWGPIERLVEMDQAKADTPLSDDENITLQELLNALGDIPGVYDKVDAYMRGRGIGDPSAHLEALRAKTF